MSDAKKDQDRLTEFMARYNEISKSDLSYKEKLEKLGEIAEELGVIFSVTLKEDRRKKPPTGETLLTKELSDFEEGALSPVRFLERQMTEDFDTEIRKDIVVFSKKQGQYLEEFRFDKDSINFKGKMKIPSPQRMKRDLRASMKLLLEKGENPFSYSDKERLLALGYTEDEIKQASGRDYENARLATIQLAELKYKKWLVDKDGNKKLVRIKQLSPYEDLQLPETPGKQYSLLMRDSYLKSLNTVTFELKKGRFKTLPQKNPYAGQFVEEKAFDFLQKSVKGRNLEIKTETILTGKLNIQTKDLQRKKLCLSYIDRWLTVAKEEGYLFEIDNSYRGKDKRIQRTGKNQIIDFLKAKTLQEIEGLFGAELKTKRITDPDLLGDCRKWKITFFSNKFELKFKLTDMGKLLAQAITYWLHDENDFGIKNPPERTRTQLESFIRWLGEDEVRLIFDETRENPELFEEVDGQIVNQSATLWNKLKAARTAKYKKSGVEPEQVRNK